MLYFTLCLSDVCKERMHANLDQHASGIPADPVQSRALPQPEPLLQQPRVRSCLPMPFHLLTGLPSSSAYSLQD